MSTPARVTNQNRLADMTIAELERERATANGQRRVCLPLDKAGWQRIYDEAGKELTRRGKIVFPLGKNGRAG